MDMKQKEMGRKKKPTPGMMTFEEAAVKFNWNQEERDLARRLRWGWIFISTVLKDYSLEELGMLVEMRDNLRKE